jgi:sigma-E factor negative regulatory protein RseA
MDKEQLSALLDGELDELATARLLSALDSDEEGLAHWDDYALIGDVLREREAFSSAGAAGARRALAMIADEPAPQRIATARPRRSLMRPLLPWALAASAAAVSFVAGTSTAGLQMAGDLSRPLRTIVSDWNGSEAVAPMAVAAPAEVVDRYIDFHRELANPGFQRTSFGGGSGVGSAQER